MSASTKGEAGVWTEVKRGGETIWVHESAPVWVVHYEPIEDSQSFRHEFYQPYIAIEAVKKGREVWAHNNKRIGKEGEFKTLADSLAAAETAVAALNPAAAWPFPKGRKS